MALTSARALMLSSVDNVAAVLDATPGGIAVSVTLNASGEFIGELSALSDIPFGHKIALQSIGRGQKIIRYGYAIGVATCDIAEGEHVHTHNMRSLLASAREIDGGESAQKVPVRA